jgi:hypothetical protein
MQEGRARVRNAQHLFEFIAQRNEGFDTAILELMSDEDRTAIFDAPRTAWIPIELDARFVDAVVKHYGTSQAEALWAEYSARFTRTPLQRAFFEGAVRLFGLSVETFVKLIPRVWSTSFRDVGEPTVTEHGEGWRRLRLAGLHPTMLSQPGYAILLRGLFRGIYELAGHDDANFELHEGEDEGELVATFFWAPLTPSG